MIRLHRVAGLVTVIALALGLDSGALCIVGGPSLANVAFAQSSGREKKRKVPNITEATFKQLSDAQEAVDAEDWQTALEILNRMVERSRRYNGNERGQIHNMLAYVNYELDRIDQTIYHYEQVLAQVPDITEVVENTTLQHLSKLYFQ